MKNLHRFMVVAMLATMITTTLFAQNDQQLKKERVITSYMIAFGRQPNSGELTYWTGRENLSVEQLVNLHNQFLNSNTDEKRKVIARAFENSYGYAPNENQVKENMRSSYNYTQWMGNHLAYLRSNATAWNDMISKVYWNVCKRGATDNDRRSWKQSDAKPYMLVAAVVDVWNRQNTSGSLSVSKTSAYLSQTPVSPTVANEASRLIGAAGGNVIAPGGGNVIAVGGGNVIAPGGANVIAVGGGN